MAILIASMNGQQCVCSLNEGKKAWFWNINLSYKLFISFYEI